MDGAKSQTALRCMFNQVSDAPALNDGSSCEKHQRIFRETGLGNKIAKIYFLRTNNAVEFPDFSNATRLRPSLALGGAAFALIL